MTHKIWDELEQESQRIMDDYYARQKKAFAEEMQLGDFDPDAQGGGLAAGTQDPFAEVYQGPEMAQDPMQEQAGTSPIGFDQREEQGINANISPFENMMMGGDE